MPRLTVEVKIDGVGVRAHSIKAVNALEFEVNFRKATKQPVVTDHARYPQLRSTLLALLNHPDAQAAANVLATYGAAVAPYKAAVQRQLLRDTDAGARAALKKLLSVL